MSDSIRNASLLLAQRYLDIIQNNKKEQPENFPDNEKTSLDNLCWMCDRIITSSDMPVDKISRWIGFIQGVLVCRGLTTCDVERDFSRPIFHKAYRDSGVAIPQTLEKPDNY